MNKCTVIKGNYHSPHVYFIISNDVVYIGETQVLPFRRWSSHLDSNGSFNKKLTAYLGGESKHKYMSSIAFCCYKCFSDLESIQGNYCGFRVPTQALEHKLHELVILQKPFGSDKTVISETKKTAPRQFFHWDQISDIAEKILLDAKNQLAL